MLPLHNIAYRATFSKKGEAIIQDVVLVRHSHVYRCVCITHTRCAAPFSKLSPTVVRRSCNAFGGNSTPDWRVYGHCSAELAAVAEHSMVASKSRTGRSRHITSSTLSRPACQALISKCQSHRVAVGWFYEFLRASAVTVQARTNIVTGILTHQPPQNPFDHGQRHLSHAQNASSGRKESDKPRRGSLPSSRL